MARQLLHGASVADAVQTGLEAGQAAYRSINACWAEEVDEHYAFSAEELIMTPEDRIDSSSYVVSTLKAALWCLLTTESYAACVLKAANLGRDSDTTASVAGGLAGLAYGYGAIPAAWVNTLQHADLIEEQCCAFCSVIDR